METPQNQNPNGFFMTLKTFFWAFIVKVAVGIAVGVLLGYTLFSHKEIGGNVDNSEQAKTDEVIEYIMRNDSITLKYAEQAMYYRELHLEVQAKYDDLHLSMHGSANRIDSLVHSDFESLPDSTRLAYRERVIARLSE